MGGRLDDACAPDAVQRSDSRAHSSAEVSLRRFPYPFRSMLAICSDLDETPNRQVYLESSRFLNTLAQTCMGQGVGLEVGNTIYFDMPPAQFAYWNTDERGRETVRTLIRSGHVDCLHSFGDLAATRAQAARSLEDLERHGCRLKIWIDHATAPTNFGADIMRGSGDLVGSPAFHADLTLGYGIEYVWRGRVTSMIGQGVSPSLGALFNARHPVASTVTTAKEFAKVMLARRGDAKYGPHAANQVTWETTLRTGAPVVEFLRCNPHFAGPSGGDTAVGIPEVLNDRLISRLAARQGFCILYTHLGKIASEREPFGPAARRAFAHLAERQASGDVLVATTRRLLDYVRRMEALAHSSQRTGDVTTIRVQPIDGSHPLTPHRLEGVTFYVPSGGRVRVLCDGADISDWFVRNPPDAAGRASVSIPWRRLEFPQDL